MFAVARQSMARVDAGFRGMSAMRLGISKRKSWPRCPAFRPSDERLRPPFRRGSSSSSKDLPPRAVTTVPSASWSKADFLPTEQVRLAGRYLNALGNADTPFGETIPRLFPLLTDRDDFPCAMDRVHHEPASVCVPALFGVVQRSGGSREQGPLAG